MSFAPVSKFVATLMMAAPVTVWGALIEVQFNRPPSFPNDARCLVEVFVGDTFCTSQEVGPEEQWHATMQYTFDSTQKTGRAVFSVIDAPDWVFRRPEKNFPIEQTIGLGRLTPEPRAKAVSNALKESRDITGSSNRKSEERVENATESLKGASAAVTTNKDTAEILVEWNELAAISNSSKALAKNFVMSKLPTLNWESFNTMTKRTIFIAASGVAEKFTQQKGGKKSKLGLYGNAADTIPEAAELWDAVISAYAKANPEYLAAIANPTPEKLAEFGSMRAFKEEVFRTFIYGSKK